MGKRDTSNSPIREVKDRYYWYHFYLFKDEEFQTEARALIDYLRGKYPGLPGYDDDWLKMASADSADLKMAKDIGRRYQTSATQVYRYGSGFYDGEMPINPSSAAGSIKNGHIVIEFDPYVTQNQYRAYWQMFKILKQQMGLNPKARTRGAEDYALIYAIHRYRHATPKITFPQIFDQYARGTLPGYKGSRTHFADYKSLESYYHKYKFLK